MNIRELQKALRRKVGAVEERYSHHVYYVMTIGERVHRVAKFSHSAHGQLPNIVLSNTAKRLKLQRPELDQLVDCQLSVVAFKELWGTRSIRPT